MKTASTRTEQSRILLSQAPASQLGGLFVALITVGFFWGQADTVILVSWLAAFLFVTCLRGALWLSYRPAERLTDNNAPRWQQLLMLLLATTGMVWAVSFWLLFDIDKPLSAGMLIAIKACLIAGAIGALAPSMNCYIVYTLPIAVIVVAMLISNAATVGSLIPLGFTLFYIICVLYTRTMQQTIIESIELRQQREQLIQELEQAADAAREDSAAKTRFIAVASHDLMQPIHALELFMHSLRRTRNPELIEPLVRNASRSTRTLSELFTSMMDVSKLEIGSVEPVLSKVQLDEVVADMQDEFATLAEEKGLALSTDINPVAVTTDVELLQRIVRNLLSNAIRYTESGTVTLRTGSDDARPVLEVTDTGIGIPESELPRIFKDFYQAAGSKRGGLGLGLSIVSRLSALLDIQIAVRSAVGNGTSFLLTLPPADASGRT